MNLGRLYRLSMSCWASSREAIEDWFTRGKNSPQILQAGLSFPFPALLFPQPKSREEKSGNGDAIVLFCLPNQALDSRNHLISTSVPSSGSNRFHDLTVIWHLLWATLYPRLARTLISVQWHPSLCLVAKSISSHGHHRISLSAKIAGMWSYAWQLHWLLKRGPFYLGFLGTSACCLLFLLLANSFNSFQHPFPRLYSLILSLTCHSTLGVIFKIVLTKLSKIILRVYIMHTDSSHPSPYLPS